MNVQDHIIDSCGFSPEMGDYLKSQALNEYRLTEIITGAPLKLSEKLGLYALLENEDAKHMYHETQRALSELTLKSGEVFSLEEAWYDYDIFDDTTAFQFLFTSYDAAIRYLRKQIAEEGWDDETECWSEMRKWIPKNDGTMDETYIYYLLKDEVVYFKQTEHWPFQDWQGYVDSRELDLPIPFKPGDIVRLNSLPFTPLRQAILIEVNNGDCCGVQILYRHEDDGLWRTGALKHGAGWLRTRPLLSSLYRLQKTEPDDSDEGKLLKKVREYINGTPGKGKKLWGIMNHYEQILQSKGLTEAFIKSQFDSSEVSDEMLDVMIDELEKQETQAE